MLTGCSGGSSNADAFVIMTEQLDGLFNPFFYTSAPDGTIVSTLTGGMLKEYDGWTSKFIFPEYNFQVANSMIANFYNPYSTMLMLTAAFGGYELIMHAYDVALKEEYRFGIYGDAMLIID